MQRIMIIGAPGSGKSTLARAMADRLGLPVHFMDHIHWKPGWVERDPAEKTEMVRAVIAQEAWVFEGGHSTTYAERLARAELLIWLDMGLSLRIWRVIRRSLRDHGRVRPDMQVDCPETLSMMPDFLAFIWTTRHTSRARMQALYESATIPKHHFRNLHQVQAYLATLDPTGETA
ncbi:MAG: hypothetical protein CML68_14835 [Rhodobacteraceae bacterium]|nr:hypothetical protein [Paracoccaceae bacterium]